MDANSNDELGFDQVIANEPDHLSGESNTGNSNGSEFDAEEYSKKVQRRINKEVGKRKELEDKNEELKVELDELKRNVAEFQSTKKANDIDDKINKLKVDRKELYLSEDADALDRIDEITDQLADLRLQKRELEQNPGKVDDNSNSQTEKKPNQQASVSKAEANWLSNNKWFQTDTEKQQKALLVYKELIDEEYDATDESFYDELDQRLNKSSSKNNTEREREREREPSGVIPDQEGDQGSNNSKNAAGLTESDKIMMDRLNMDPNNPKHRERWLKEKRAR